MQTWYVWPWELKDDIRPEYSGKYERGIFIQVNITPSLSRSMPLLWRCSPYLDELELLPRSSRWAVGAQAEDTAVEARLLSSAPLHRHVRSYTRLNLKQPQNCEWRRRGDAGRQAVRLAGWGGAVVLVLADSDSLLKEPSVWSEWASINTASYIY